MQLLVPKALTQKRAILRSLIVAPLPLQVLKRLPMIQLQDQLLPLGRRVEATTICHYHHRLIKTLRKVVQHQPIEHLPLVILFLHEDTVVIHPLIESSLRDRQLGRLIFDREVVLPKLHLALNHPVVLKNEKPHRQHHHKVKGWLQYLVERDTRCLHRQQLHPLPEVTKGHQRRHKHPQHQCQRYHRHRGKEKQAKEY